MKVQLSSFLREVSDKTTVNDQYPVLTSSKAGLFLQSDYFNKQVASKDNTGYKIIRRGQFTYRAMSDTGEFFPNMLECADIGIVSPAYPVFEIMKPGLILPEYLKFFFKSDAFQHSISAFAQGSTRTSVKFSKMQTVLISLPPIDEQRRIVEVLNRAQELVTARETSLSTLDTLTKARFVEMFGDINTNDRGWDVQPLGELCTIVRGGSPRPIEDYLGGDVPWIKIGDATEGESIYLHSTKEHIIQEGVKRSRLVKSGSLIFANCGVSLGFARIITFDGCIHDGWLAMEDIDPRLDKVFLLQALNQMTKHFREIAPAGTQPNLNTAIMKAYKQIIPPMELQKSYIAFVTQVDKSKVVVQKALEEAQLLFDSLMQTYFG